MASEFEAKGLKPLLTISGEIYGSAPEALLPGAAREVLDLLLPPLAGLRPQFSLRVASPDGSQEALVIVSSNETVRPDRQKLGN
jgi:hypothetical protein